MSTWLEKQFHLKEYQTSARTEIIAGLTTFIAMAYVLATVPNMLGNAGLDKGAVLTLMILLIIGTSLAMAFVTNRPFALAPGLGSVSIVAGMMANDGVSPEHAAGVIFWSGIIFCVISFLGMREAVVKVIPKSLKAAVTAGVGLFIALLGAKQCGLVVANEAKSALGFGDLTSPTVILALIGFVLIMIAKVRKIPGGMILAILITTLIGIPMGITTVPESIVSLPLSPAPQLFRIDFLGSLKFAYIPFLIALFIPDFFSTFGTVLGVGGMAGYLDENGDLPGIDKCFRVDAVATVAGGLFGIPSMTTYFESSAGVEAGGRTGLTVVGTCIGFVLALFLAPLALMIPSAATAPALISIGVGMLNSMRQVNYSDYTEAFPAFLCIAFTLFGNNIANGICVAIPVYLLLKLISGKVKEINAVLIIVTAVCGLYFYTLVR
ncbi:MAG: NCS2 family permease [Lachnospiraceae bacterium]|nr:NCS2 family permease [Lachnospiraceae bacterium]